MSIIFCFQTGWNDLKGREENKNPGISFRGGAGIFKDGMYSWIYFKPFFRSSSSISLLLMEERSALS